MTVTVAVSMTATPSVSAYASECLWWEKVFGASLPAAQCALRTA